MRITSSRTRKALHFDAIYATFARGGEANGGESPIEGEIPTSTKERNMPEKTRADMVELDRFDLAILEILQRENKRPQRSIAEAIGLSAPAVQRRVKRMEETGTIMANVAVVNPSHVRQEITVFVEVEMHSEHKDMHDQAKKAFSEAPEVQ